MWTVIQPRTGQFSSVSCPLCRKVSTLACGLASLPVNTTLAEVVRLLPQNGRARERQPAGEPSGDPDSITSGPGPNSCAEHPEYRLELFCKSCEQACCGKCVSLRHQGIFHSVNLLDVIYQEEKLVFFNSLKTLRENHEKFTKEISEDEKKAESILKANEDAVTSAFGEVQKALDLKKQQLLELVKQQQCASISEVRKVTKARRKTTVESLLKECENIVDDFEPRSFLQVACGLNKRMKCNLELIEFCADRSEDVLGSEPQRVDIQAALDAVSTLTITSASKDVSKQDGSFSFKSVSRTWNDEMATNEKYCPVQDQEVNYLQGQIQKMSIRFVCITRMPEYQHLSYEELRLKYYDPSVVQEKEAVSAPERQQPFVFNNVNYFNFKMSLLNSKKSTRVKRQNTFAWDRAVNNKDVFKEKSTKTEPGRVVQRVSLFACAVKKDPVEGDYPSSSLRGLTSKLPPEKVEKTSKFCSDGGNKASFPNFCLGKSETATIKKSSRNEKSCKKLKSTSCASKTPSAGSVASTSAMAAESSNPFSSVGNAEEDGSVNSASSEEFYDASCNIDPDVEEPCEQSSSHSSIDDDELSSSQRSQH